jgi:hypothetical protein
MMKPVIAVALSARIKVPDRRAAIVAPVLSTLWPRANFREVTPTAMDDIAIKLVMARVEVSIAFKKARET